jgi:alkanesulfonate monooxygenase SsuD/methylene tetrahydromethanopterin reductase-like flavin-dependent oxidoreductase (luciferase family)
MKVFQFHLMPYADIDLEEAKKYRSVWIRFPNSNFDPKKGHKLYNRYLDELEMCAELGFDGIAVNEHHQNAYGMMPSPVVMAAALSRRTKDCKIAILGSGFGLRDNPLLLAEEHAMIDNITGGRLISGFVRGIGAEYYSLGVNPVTSHAKSLEAHDLVKRAWTEPGPFRFEGKYYNFEYVNVWPRPYQQPHPPIWIPSIGSSETLEWAAHPDRKYPYLQAYTPYSAMSRYLNGYREVAQRKYGYAASSGQLGWTAPVYVGETDEKAMDEARPHIETMFNTLLSLYEQILLPPGYVSLPSLKRMMSSKGAVLDRATIEMMVREGIMVCGSPDTVRKRLEHVHREIGMGTFVAMMQFGTLPADLTEKSIRRFVAEVMPALQALGDKEYKGFELPTVAAE